MAHSGASAAMRITCLHAPDNLFHTGDRVQLRETRPLLLLRPAFSTRAYARLLDGLGWNVDASARRETEWHRPGRFCFVLRDGPREEVAFGYTGLTLPQDAAAPELRAAQRWVERFLDRLGEERGVLLQNVPLLAFSGHRRDRMALFGGWRFNRGQWKPFLLGPGGLGGVSAQEALFTSKAKPSDLALACGHPVEQVLSRLGQLVVRLETLDRIDDIHRTAKGQPVRLRIVPFGAGWSIARPNVMETDEKPTPLRLKGWAGSASRWDPDADDFRFARAGGARA